MVKCETVVGVSGHVDGAITAFHRVFLITLAGCDFVSPYLCTPTIVNLGGQDPADRRARRTS